MLILADEFFESIDKNEVKNHDEANVFYCGKTKLCRLLHSFGMFTQLT